MSMRPELGFVSVVVLASAGVASALFMEDAGTPGTYGQRASSSFVNWETPHTHPIGMTPDGSRLLAVNTPDNRLAVFNITGSNPVLIAEVPVGLDPVAVRARTNTEVWVVNHISDSVSIVDLTTMNVRATLKTQDEPRDVVFAGNPQRAFVSCSQPNVVQVFDPANLAASPQVVSINAENPRALAVSPDGNTVYVAVFESGNRSTILGGGIANTGAAMRLGYPPNVVQSTFSPYYTGGSSAPNPPPNSGNTFNPPIATPNPPAVGLIVKKNDAGRWMDDNNRDWTDVVSGPNAAQSGRLPGWDLPDRDLAAINANTLSVTYATTLMNLCMSVGVNPATGAITVVGTDALNEVRFEPVINGKFLRVKMGTVSASDFSNKTIVDLNPHLTYSGSTIPQAQRERGIGDPRAIVWNAAGTLGFVAGMGSNNVVVINPAGARSGLSETIPVGEGPTGLALDEARGRLYVMNKFSSTISTVSLSSQSVTHTAGMYDPSPSAIKVGRKHLYDTHRNSGLGQIACASCHVDARMDRLAWDLGDPSGAMQPLVDLNLGFGIPGLTAVNSPVPFAPFHPMKGPMTTQTMQDIIGHEPHHWRGDRSGLEAFAPAFHGLQGHDLALDPASMQEFENFLATITFPPNPFRNFDNTLPTDLPLPGHYTTGRFSPPGQPLPNGSAVRGLSIYRSTTRRLDAGAFACVTCHTLPTGMGPDATLVGATFQPIAPGPNGQRHRGLVSVDGSTNVTIKVPHTRNVRQKSGFNTTLLSNNAGFGFLHDGSVDSIERFLSEPVFNVQSDQEVADLTALMLAFSGSDFGTPLPGEPPGGISKDTHAAVGAQITLSAPPTSAQTATINSMIALANANRVGLVAKGRRNGLQRGYTYLGGGNWQSDRVMETTTTSALQAASAPGSEITFTVVPFGSQVRIGIDRDLDTYFDRDELDACGDPANPANHSGTCPCAADVDDGTGSGNPDGGVTIDDLLYYLALFDSGDIEADIDDGSQTGTTDGGVTIDDLLYYLLRFDAGC